MATKEYWEVDPTAFREMWLRVVGEAHEDPIKTEHQALRIFDREMGTACLEIGAGIGRLLVPALKHFTWAYGVDYSASLTALSTRYLVNHKNARVIFGDGVTLPFPDNWFDFVYSFTCFQHMPTLEIIQSNLREAYRVLRLDGKCRIQTVRGENGTGKHDGYVFSDEKLFLQEFMDAGFDKAEAITEGEWIWATGMKSSS